MAKAGNQNDDTDPNTKIFENTAICTFRRKWLLGSDLTLLPAKSRVVTVFLCHRALLTTLA